MEILGAFAESCSRLGRNHASPAGHGMLELEAAVPPPMEGWRKRQRLRLWLLLLLLLLPMAGAAAAAAAQAAAALAGVAAAAAQVRPAMEG